LKAVRFHEFGGLDVLGLEEVEDPQAGPGQVVLAVEACALNHLDVDLRDGVSRFPVSFPHTPGLEIVGRVESTGSGVEGWQPGDRAMPYLLGGGEAFLGVTAPGGYAEKIVCPATQLVRAPDGLPAADLAALQVAFGTSWHMLFARAKLEVGETVMVNSVGSGIGSAAVQLAKLAGAFVIGNASSDEKLEHAKAFGLDVGINYTTQDVVEEVMRATDGRGVDVVYEHAGGELFQKGLDSLTFSGRLVTCGAHAGEVVDFDIIPFFRGQKSIIGSFVYSQDEFEKCLRLYERGRIKPLVHATFPLDKAADAMAVMERREHFGKIVLTPNGSAA
jgi:NADPH:quinone reductase-like Zn-dependent oxidoreductase